jgi:hypothetical protein
VEASTKTLTLALILVGLAEYKCDVEIWITIGRDAIFLDVSVLQVD